MEKYKSIYIIYGNYMGLFMQPITKSFLSLGNLGFPLNNIEKIIFRMGFLNFPLLLLSDRHHCSIQLECS